MGNFFSDAWDSAKDIGKEAVALPVSLATAGQVTGDDIFGGGLEESLMGTPDKSETKRQDMPKEFIPFWNQFVNQFFGTGPLANSALLSTGADKEGNALYPGGTISQDGTNTGGYRDMLQRDFSYGKGTETGYNKKMDQSAETRRGTYSDLLNRNKAANDLMIASMQSGKGLGAPLRIGASGQPGQLSFVPRGQREQMDRILGLYDKSTGIGTNMADVNYNTDADIYGRGKETALKYSPESVNMSYLQALQGLGMAGQNARNNVQINTPGKTGVVDYLTAASQIAGNVAPFVK